MHWKSPMDRLTVRAALAVLAMASTAGVAMAATVQPAAASARSETTATSTPTTTGALIAQVAKSQRGIPYCEGGGGIDGPTVGDASSACAPGVRGYDCMSLAQNAVYQVTGIIVPLSGALPGPGTFIPPNGTVGLKPGDVVFFGGSSLDSYAHSGIYAGHHEIWDALAPGQGVQQHTWAQLDSDYGNVYQGAVRFSTTASPFGITTTSLPDGTVSSQQDVVYYAQDLGFFTRAGIDAEITTFANGAQVSTGVASGAIDIGISSVITLANATIRGLPFVYVAGGGMYTASAPTIVLCVAKDSATSDARELEGKAVSVSGIKDITHLAVVAYLIKGGADPANQASKRK